MKEKIAILSLCITSSCSYAKNNQDFDNIIKCYGDSTEYTLVENGLYVQPDGGCIYNGETNKVGNAIAYIIQENKDNKSTVLYKEFKNLSKVFIFLVPKDDLIKDKNSESGFYPKNNYTIKMYEKKGSTWIFLKDFNVKDDSNIVYKNIENIMLHNASIINSKYSIKNKFNMDVNHDGIVDLIEVIAKKDRLNSIIITDGKNQSLLYENKNIFNTAFNDCIYSSFDNISISKTNFTLEYTTCSDSSKIGHRYSTFRTEKNNEPILIQDNYLIYPQSEIPDNFKPQKVNCLGKEKIYFSEYSGRCK